MTGEPVVARIGDGVASFRAADWDACAGTDDPFLSHAFLSALEDSGSATAATGWRPLPVAIDGRDGRPAALMPAWLKSHSLGEYVFDHAWAEALERAGTTVCEPTLLVALVIPAWSITAVLTTLGRLGAAVSDQSVRGELCAVEAVVSASRLRELQRQLPGLTAGEGVLESAFNGYRPLGG